MVEWNQDQYQENAPLKEGIKFWSIKPFCENMPAKKKQSGDQQGEKYIGNQRCGLNFIPVIYIFRFAQEFDHRVAEKSLFDCFDQCKNSNEQSPDTHFFNCRKNPFRQDNIANDSKSNEGKPVKQGKKN